MNNFEILNKRFEDDIKELTESAKAYRNKNKDVIIKLTELVYRDNIQDCAPNYLFSIIEDIITNRDNELHEESILSEADLLREAEGDTYKTYEDEVCSKLFVSRACFEAIFEDTMTSELNDEAQIHKLVIRDFDDYDPTEPISAPKYGKSFLLRELDEAWEYFESLTKCRVMNQNGVIYLDIY